MKRLFILLFALFTVSFASCQTVSTSKKDDYPGLETFLDGYYHQYYSFPVSLDELIAEIETRSSYVNPSFIDTFNITLTNLRKDKNQINWVLSDECFLNEELLVLKGEDTIMHRYNPYKFPCLGVLLNNYRYYYLDYPETIEELSAFTKVEGYVEEPSFKGCDSITMQNLFKGEERGVLTWKNDKDGLLIMANNDTVDYLPPYSPCDLSPFEKRRIVLLFDKNKTVVLSNKMEVEFKKGLYSVLKEFPFIDEKEKGNYHIMCYRQDKGLHLYCENDYLPQDPELFSTLNTFAHQFAEENNLDEIIFCVVYCCK